MKNSFLCRCRVPHCGGGGGGSTGGAVGRRGCFRMTLFKQSVISSNCIYLLEFCMSSLYSPVKKPSRHGKLLKVGNLAKCFFFFLGVFREEYGGQELKRKRWDRRRMVGQWEGERGETGQRNGMGGGHVGGKEQE